MNRHLEEAWQESIRPTLADLKGDAWFLGKSSRVVRSAGREPLSFSRRVSELRHPIWRTVCEAGDDRDHLRGLEGFGNMHLKPGQKRIARVFGSRMGDALRMDQAAWKID
jgi:hypothetical protein